MQLPVSARFRCVANKRSTATHPCRNHSNSASTPLAGVDFEALTFAEFSNRYVIGLITYHEEERERIERSTKWKRGLSMDSESKALSSKTTVTYLGHPIGAPVFHSRGHPPGGDMDRDNSHVVRSLFEYYDRNDAFVLPARTGAGSLKERLAEWRRRFGRVLTQSWRHGTATRTSSSPAGWTLRRKYPNSSELGCYRGSYQSSSTMSDLGLSLMDSRISELLRLENQPRDTFADSEVDFPYAKLVSERKG